MTAFASLKSPRILVVDDESVIEMLVDDILLDLGFTVVGVASRLQSRLDIATNLGIDVAVLDMNFETGVPSFPIATILRDRDVPFIFAKD